jgi:hypothetical protein
LGSKLKQIDDVPILSTPRYYPYDKKVILNELKSKFKILLIENGSKDYYFAYKDWIILFQFDKNYMQTSAMETKESWNEEYEKRQKIVLQPWHNIKNLPKMERYN